MRQTDNKPLTLLANFTAESLAMRLCGEGVDARTTPGFDTWRMELLSEASPIWQETQGVLLLLLHGPALFPDGVDAGFAGVLDDALALIRGARDAHPDRTLVVSTLDLPSPPALPLAAEDPAREASHRWRSGLAAMELPVLDLESLAAEVGRTNFYNAKTWYFGALPFSAEGEKRLAQEAARVLRVLNCSRKKCLVLDLDDTLWGGVISEDGLEGIALSDHGVGAVYRDVQTLVKALSAQGVLLAVNSKNDLEDALLPFRKHPHAVLQEEDFAVVRANWRPKPENVRDIAGVLNIGMDSMVFIDDNPAERAAVRAACPEVEVPEFPSDTSALPAFIRKVADQFFTAPRLSAEDAGKTAMYRAEAQRAEARAHASLEDYLASLEMQLSLRPLNEEEIPRAAQLCAKTNQFNLTTHRYSEADLRALTRDKRRRAWIAGLSDRYGDYGRIALVIAELDKGETSASFDTFLMSCRAMGRGVESALLAWVEELLAAEGVTRLTGHYLPTAKNGPVKDFWRDMGYAKTGDAWTLSAPFPERRSCLCRNS